MTTLTPETSPKSSASIERGKLVVSQPAKLKELNMLLESLENLDTKVSETTGEDRSRDLGAAGASGTSATGSGQSARDRAIAHLPAPESMQRRLQSNILQEVSQLQRQAKRASMSSRPGSAFRVNELYARIRRLNTLLSELISASVDVIRRLFIRVFIDKQPIL